MAIRSFGFGADSTLIANPAPYAPHKAQTGKSNRDAVSLRDLLGGKKAVKSKTSSLATVVKNSPAKLKSGIKHSSTSAGDRELTGVAKALLSKIKKESTVKNPGRKDMAESKVSAAALRAIAALHGSSKGQKKNPSHAASVKAAQAKTAKALAALSESRAKATQKNPAKAEKGAKGAKNPSTSYHHKALAAKRGYRRNPDEDLIEDLPSIAVLQREEAVAEIAEAAGKLADAAASTAEAAATVAEEAGKGRGRPKGSKNKPKVAKDKKESAKMAGAKEWVQGKIGVGPNAGKTYLKYGNIVKVGSTQYTYTGDPVAPFGYDKKGKPLAPLGKTASGVQRLPGRVPAAQPAAPAAPPSGGGNRGGKRGRKKKEEAAVAASEAAPSGRGRKADTVESLREKVKELRAQLKAGGGAGGRDKKSLTPIVFGGIDVGAAAGGAAVTAALRSVQSRFVDSKLTEWGVPVVVQDFILPAVLLTGLHFGKKYVKNTKVKQSLEWVALSSLVFAVMRSVGRPIDSAIGGNAFGGAWAVNGKAALQPFYPHQAGGAYLRTNGAASKRLAGAYVPVSKVNGLLGAYLQTAR